MLLPEPARTHVTRTGHLTSVTSNRCPLATVPTGSDLPGVVTEVERLYGRGHAGRATGAAEDVRPPGEDVVMERQLTLIDTTTRTWRLDERTREVGRRGIASARAALAAHRPTEDDTDRNRAA